jgi:hypothetical protein
VPACYLGCVVVAAALVGYSGRRWRCYRAAAASLRWRMRALGVMVARGVHRQYPRRRAGPGLAVQAKEAAAAAAARGAAASRSSLVAESNPHSANNAATAGHSRPWLLCGRHRSTARRTRIAEVVGLMRCAPGL